MLYREKKRHYLESTQRTRVQAQAHWLDPETLRSRWYNCDKEIEVCRSEELALHLSG